MVSCNIQSVLSAVLCAKARSVMHYSYKSVLSVSYLSAGIYRQAVSRRQTIQNSKRHMFKDKRIQFTARFKFQVSDQ